MNNNINSISIKLQSIQCNNNNGNSNNNDYNNYYYNHHNNSFVCFFLILYLFINITFKGIKFKPKLFFQQICKNGPSTWVAVFSRSRKMIGHSRKCYFKWQIKILSSFLLEDSKLFSKLFIQVFNNTKVTKSCA